MHHLRLPPPGCIRQLAMLLLAASSAGAQETGTSQRAAHAPGAIFRDCQPCPEMVVVPPGEFIMGSTAEERHALKVPSRFDEMETPRHRVSIARAFAVGRYAVTFAEWDSCVASGGCGGYRPDDRGWGRGRQPVINVDWADTQAYIHWLNGTSGRAYRLLSEAEWEYAARAGTGTIYYFGDSIDDSKANYGGHRSRALPVGSFAPNPFGLYDMTGNTAQWVEDCHHDSYAHAPADGSAWVTGACLLRNVRGGAWVLSGWSVRSAQRIGDPPDSRNDHLGFRVARSLSP